MARKADNLHNFMFIRTSFSWVFAPYVVLMWTDDQVALHCRRMSFQPQNLVILVTDSWQALGSFRLCRLGPHT